MSISAATSSLASSLASSLSGLSQNNNSKQRNTPEVSSVSTFSAEDKKISATRGLSADQQKKVESIYANAREAVKNGQGKTYLAKLDAQSLQALQGVAGLGAPINVASVSEEGAENLLLPPSESVDLNNDGHIEIGIARTVQFPPAGASKELVEAWEKSTVGLSDGDKLTASLLLIGATTEVPVYGSDTKSINVSQDYDWNTYVENRIYTNNISRFNDPGEHKKIDDFLNNFLSSLKEQGLA